MKKFLLKLLINIFSLLARLYIKIHKPYIIWITWSVWKTTARFIVYNILKEYWAYSLENNYNWELWLSLSILHIDDYKPTFLWIIKSLIKWLLNLRKKEKILILEYWIDHPWEMDFMLWIVKPNISITTFIDKVHVENYESFDQLINEKLKLARNTKEIAFLNYDNKYLRVDLNIDRLFFSHKDKVDIYLEDYDQDFDETKWTLYLWNKKVEVKTNIIWKEEMTYIWVWLAIKQILTWVLEDKVNLNFKLLPWRFTVYKSENIIIDSSYNAAPASMEKVLNTVYNIKKEKYSNYDIILVLWDMRELWDMTEQEHRKLALLAFSISNEIFLVWDSMKKYFMDELFKIWYSWFVKHFKNSLELWYYLKDYLKDKKNKIIIFKWSQNTIFLEEAIKILNINIPLCRQEKYWLKKKKKFFWFTLIEILVVILVIGIILFSLIYFWFRYFLKLKFLYDVEKFLNTYFYYQTQSIWYFSWYNTKLSFYFKKWSDKIDIYLSTWNCQDIWVYYKSIDLWSAKIDKIYINKNYLEEWYLNIYYKDISNDFFSKFCYTWWDLTIVFKWYWFFYTGMINLDIWKLY